MFGGNPSKNPFGAPPSKASNIFGSPQDATSRKRGKKLSLSLELFAIADFQKIYKFHYLLQTHHCLDNISIEDD